MLPRVLVTDLTLNRFEDYEISDTGLIRQGVRPITLQPNGKGYLRFIKMRDRR